MSLRTGILLINLGSPSGTSEAEMRMYLREFLSDRRVIDRRGPLWWFILNGVILRKRPAKSGRAYATIWNNADDEAPLVTVTRKTAEALAGDRGAAVVVDWAMRYGARPIGERLRQLADQGCGRILLAPLYPQYAAATTGSALDAAYQTLSQMASQPAIRTLPPYPTHPAYIRALAIRIKAGLAGRNPDALLVSFHGLSRAAIAKGDPYQRHCEATFQALKAALEPGLTNISLCYQSRPGRGDWIGPHLEEELIRLAADGARHAAVVAPGFAADCLETLEEIDIRARETFRAAGGEAFSYLPCLNNSPQARSLLNQLVEDEAGDWL